MIKSLWQIDFLPDDGGSAIRLLSEGDVTAEEISLPAEQRAGDYYAIGAAHGRGYALGGARRSLAFSRWQEHASHAEARSHALGHPALMPWGRDGRLRMTVEGGSWELASAQVLSCVSIPLVSAGFRTLTSYRITAGAATPGAGVAPLPGWPHSWRTVAHEDQTATHAAM
jgi:hypothetical protein